MTSKRLHMVFIGLIIVLTVGLVAGAYGMVGVLKTESQKLVDAKAKSRALEQEKVSLKKAKSDIAAYAELEKITHFIVPEDKSQAEVIREIVNIAGANGITLGSVTFPASSLGEAAPSTAGGSSTKKLVGPPKAATPGKTGSLSQLEPVTSIPGVYVLPVTVSSGENAFAYSKIISFLSGLERNRRTAQVSNITLEPDSKDDSALRFSIVVNGYIKP